MFRYPGGKLRLMPKINNLIKTVYPQSYTSAWTVLDPFVGGGGSLINMAEDFPLWKFHLNDNNKEMSFFWKFFRSAKDSDFDLMYERIQSQKVDIQSYKDIFCSEPHNPFEGAFKVIFLNKTSYNGFVTEPLPIGGWDQKSKWHVNVYWTPKNIIRKIERARRALTNKILSVSMEDFDTFLNKNSADFLYCDPPYISYGKRWYKCSFGIEDLTRLKNGLLKYDKWCLSIDKHPETETLFSGCKILGVDVIHTAKSSYKTKKEKIEDRSIGTTNEMVVFPVNLQSI